MKPDRIIEPEKIHIVSLKTLKGNINGSGDIEESMILGHTFEFMVGIGVDPDEKIVGLELIINIRATGKGNEDLQVEGSYTHEVVFQVENLEDFLKITENEPPVIDHIMNATLTGIAFSTVRGIIFSRTQGTSLGTVILPVVDPKKVMAMADFGEKKSGTE